MTEEIVKRKQHYVPCAYLARFSPDADQECRKRRILRTDDTIENRPVPCESQCYREFFYSAVDTNRIEAELQELEDDLQRITEIAVNGTPTKRDLKLLIHHHAIMFSRGVAVDNLSEDSRYDAYQTAANRFLASYFYDQPIEDLMDKKFPTYLFKTYGSIVLTSKVETLITSDNPVIVFATANHKHAALSLMPLTAHKLSVVYHKDFVQAKQTALTQADIGGLNICQAFNSHEAVFSYDELPEDSVRVAREWFGKRRNPKVYHEGDRTGFDLPLVSTVRDRLSFIRSVSS